MPKRNASTKIMERASALNAISEKKAALIYALSSDSPELSRDKLELASYACNACNTVFATQKDAVPMCVNCGSHDNEVVEFPVQASDIAPDEELASVPCPVCGTHNIIASEVIATLKGSMNCVECGTQVDFTDTQEQTQQDGTQGEQVDVTETEELEDASGEQQDQTQQDDQQQDATQEQQDPLQQTGEQDQVQDDLGGDPLVQDATQQQQQDIVTEDEVQVSLLKHVPAQAKASFEPMRGALYAFVNDTPVAVLREENAGEFKDVYHSKGFLEALRHTSVQAGLEKTLLQYGFKPVTVSLAKKSVFDEKASTELAAAKKALSEATANTTKQFAEALSIAAMGLNKNFFKGKAHVLKAAFFDELTSVGVRNPARLVDRVFASQGDAFNKVLLETALEMMGKTQEARASIAESLRDSNYQPVAASDQDDEDSVGSPEVVSEASDAVVANLRGASVTPILDLQKRAGGRLFR